ncbi:DNA cytosine methyltransferase [Lysinibacillus sp. KU-BSD001]|uniref:DNA cytosine methyltransferase n=1 Tax=Lysinibacillus sp. KU-BSD001 TaxID=3141328 RepID=UPI0036E91A38
MYTSIDLFSGPGGLCTGLKATGIKPLIAVEMSDWTVETYKASHNADVLNLEQYLKNPSTQSHLFEKSDKTLIIHGDITQVSNALIDLILLQRFDVQSVDLVTGGAPCESFSLAGQRKEDDERNNLFLNLERIAKHVDAKMLLFENVKGLLSKPLNGVKGDMYKLICDELEAPNVEGVSFVLASRDQNTVLLKAIEYGVPQARERVFLVGINSKYTATFTYPEKTHGEGRMFPFVTVGNAILDLPQVDSKQGQEETQHDLSLILKQDIPAQQREFLRFMNGELFPIPDHLKDFSNKINSHIGPGHTAKMIERLSYILPGEGMKKAAERLIANGREDLRNKVFPNKLYAARNRRLKVDEPSFTVTSHCLDEMVHPILNRGITPREAARLQSFPDWYQFRGPYVKFHSDPEQDRYEQIGDAIPPILGYVLGVEIVKTLEDIKKAERMLI